MLLLFAIIFVGIVVGRLLSCRRLGLIPRLISGIIWVLLFLLGLEVGADKAVVAGFVTLGSTALAICVFSIAGSILASWVLWRYIRSRGADLVCGTSESNAEDVPTNPVSTWTALKGSLIIIGFFVAGCLVGLFAEVSEELASSHVSRYVLYALMFSVGITLGHDTTLAGRVRRLNWRFALLPVATAVGTLAGAAFVSPLIAPVTAADSMAVGAGFGYYSLSSIFIADLRGAELGTIALLCNVIRELFTLVAAPLVARWFGPLAAVSIGGATTFDTTLPIITQATGRPYAVVAIFHGCMLDFSVPFLVTLFCTL